MIKHFVSDMLIIAGGLMLISALISLFIKVLYAGILLSAAACLFFAARNFRISEDNNHDGEC